MLSAKVQANRLARAEARGLRLAILLRTLAIVACAIWFLSTYPAVGGLPRGGVIVGLATFVLIGVVYYPLIGSRWDRPWVKYAIYSLDIILLCALFVLIPVSRDPAVPQIIAFRTHGIHLLLPFIGLACLSLSWGLVAWTGTLICIGWWAAFAYVVSGMDKILSWFDLPNPASLADYERVFLSVDFIGIGNRVEETGFVLILSLTLAVAVYRARTVFFAQLRAEQERERERKGRERVSQMLGQYLPETIAQRLLATSTSLEPQVRMGTALVADIEGFSAFANDRNAGFVIETLNEFLAECADRISRRDGVVISYLGDGLLATFNTPLAVENPANAALAAAHDLIELASRRTFRGQTFRLRIGIATGEIAAGMVGSSNRQAFTVYGDTVNRGSRLEQLNKATGTVLLVDEATQSLAALSWRLGPAGCHVLQGSTAAVPVWGKVASDRAHSGKHALVSDDHMEHGRKAG